MNRPTLDRLTNSHMLADMVDFIKLFLAMAPYLHAIVGLYVANVDLSDTLSIINCIARAFFNGLIGCNPLPLKISVEASVF